MCHQFFVLFAGRGSGRGRGAKLTGPPRNTNEEYPELSAKNTEAAESAKEVSAPPRNITKRGGGGKDTGVRGSGRGSVRGRGRGERTRDDRDDGAGSHRNDRSNNNSNAPSGRGSTSVNSRLARPPKNAERKVDITDDMIKVTIADSSPPSRRKATSVEEPEQDQEESSGKQTKRYSSLRQPKSTSGPAQRSSGEGQQHGFYEEPTSSASHAGASGSNSNLSDFPSKSALAAAFPAGHYPNGPPNAAPFLNTQSPAAANQPAPAPAPAAPYIGPNGMVNYGPPPVQYTPVTVPISLPLVGVPPDTFVPPGAVTAVPGGPLMPAHLAAAGVVSSPEQQVLLAAAAANSGSPGYAVERGGVTYFNPTAQAPIVQRAVNKRPKAAIPIVDPSQVGEERVYGDDEQQGLARKESSDISPQSSVEESESGGNNKVSESSGGGGSSSVPDIES